MAATSSTRRRGRPRTANRRNNRNQGEVNISFPRTLVNRVTSFIREREALAEAIQARIFATAVSETSSAQSVARTLGMPLGFEAPGNTRRQRRQPAARSRETVGTPTAPQQTTRGRGRPRTARATRRNTSGIDLANLGRGNTLADQVYRNLPAIGQTTTLANLGRGCTLPNGSAPRNQDIGAVANRLQKAGIVSRGTGPNRNQVTTLRREALAA